MSTTGLAVRAAAQQEQGGSGFPLLDRAALESLFNEETSTSATPSPQITPEQAVLSGKETAPDELLPEEPPEPDYTPLEWNAVRKKAEAGLLVSTQAAVEVSTQPAAAAEPQELPPSVEMPGYGTSLSVTGRKTLGFSYSSKQYLNPQSTTRAQSLSFFDLQQQLQVKMQGKIGPKITVGVDYDDSRTDKQDISIVYKGESQDVVQNAAFGDIDLSLPSSEFVQYSKQLFGIRVDLKYKGLSSTIIGSRTKGTTKTKEFVGNSAYQGKDILDTAYLRRQYYDVAFGTPSLHLPIRQGSERVLVDNQSYLTANGVDIIDMPADDLGVNTSSYTGRFKLLAPGVDYTLDYNNGILTFRYPLNPQDVMAINYVNASGTELRDTPDSASNVSHLLKIIKTRNDTPISQAAQELETGFRRELKTYYSLGQTQIVADDGRGNFLLKVQDLNRNPVGEKLNPPQTYPGTMLVDFEQGIFHLQRPFASVVSSTAPDSEIYAPTPVSKFIIRAEFTGRVKTFFLEPNLVAQSDMVILDGAKLTRNLDYYIDYASGYITFYNENRILSSSKIDVTYDVSPFGGLGTSSLVGGRVAYDFGSHFSVGGTALYETATKTPIVPNITDIARSLLVYESDVHFKDISLLPHLKTSIALEAAQSRTNPNLNGFALIDNMEGIKQQDLASMEFDQWQIASNPYPAPPSSPDAINWRTEDARLLDINPHSQANSGDTQHVLAVDYDLSVSNVVSIVYPYSDSGRDFSQKTLLELVVYGDGSGNELNVHLGQIDEDADGTGAMTLHCSNGLTLTAPKTEDLNCDGTIGPEEDIGWLYSPQGLISKRYGAQNGRIDTEDLNHNGRLDAQDFSGGDFGYASVTSPQFNDITANTQRATLDYTGWHTLQVPISIPASNASNWASIHQVRVSIKLPDNGTVKKGTIRLARLAVTGTSWNVASSTFTQPGSLRLSGVNNVDNSDYSPIFSAGGDATQVFNDLYGSVSDLQKQNNSSNLSEQSLALIYESTGPVSLAAQRRFSQPIDISQHGEFRFLLSNPAGNEVCASTIASACTRFFIRVGNDTDYQEASIPLDFTGWRLYTIAQDDLNGDQVSDVWRDASKYPGVTISSAGAANFQQVSLIASGIRTPDNITHHGTVWLDEVHVASPRNATGSARMAKADFNWDNWMEFGGKYRYSDRNFQTPVSVATRQDNEQDTAYLRFKRLSFLPVNADYSRQLVTTPNTLNTGNNNFVNSLQQGTVETNAGNIKGDLIINAFPRLSGGYSFARTSYELLTRLDDRRMWTGALTYDPPAQFALLPTHVDLSYALTDSKTAFGSTVAKSQAGNYNSDEITRDYGAKLTFSPWKDSTFSPSYSLKQVRESRADFTSGSPLYMEYPKSQQQTAGFTSTLKIFKWLVPSVNYSVTTIENNNLSVSTVTSGAATAVFAVGDIKNINRTANGGVNLALNPGEIIPSAKFLRTLTLSNSYQLQDGDSWQNVEKDLNTLSALWLRAPLSPQNPFAQLTNRTLRDTYTSSQKWQPFDAFNFTGRWAPLKSTIVTNNFSKSLQRTSVTGTESKVITTTLPDMVATLTQLETLLGSRGWMANTVMNVKYSLRVNETEAVSDSTEKAWGSDLRFLLKNSVDMLLSYNQRASEQNDLRAGAVAQTTLHRDAALQGTFDIRKFRLTPKVDYSLDQTVQGANSVTQDLTVITPSLMARADLNLPKGLMLPFMKSPILFTNRVIWTTTLSYSLRRSPVTVLDNSNLLSLTTNADYELSKNLRLTLNAMGQRLWHLYLPQEDYIQYQAGSMLTLQF
ncbi:MAG: hypothetical protein PHP45_05145 [Elusimicrobiales bacterium]|nr:hypothetical protein [Elusimicrobiales bacterium]